MCERQHSFDWRMEGWFVRATGFDINQDQQTNEQRTQHSLELGPQEKTRAIFLLSSKRAVRLRVAKRLRTLSGLIQSIVYRQGKQESLVRLVLGGSDKRRMSSWSNLPVRIGSFACWMRCRGPVQVSRAFKPNPHEQSCGPRRKKIRWCGSCRWKPAYNRTRCVHRQ